MADSELKPIHDMVWDGEVPTVAPATPCPSTSSSSSGSLVVYLGKGRAKGDGNNLCRQLIAGRAVDYIGTTSNDRKDVVINDIVKDIQDRGIPFIDKTGRVADPKKVKEFIGRRLSRIRTGALVLETPISTTSPPPVHSPLLGVPLPVDITDDRQREGADTTSRGGTEYHVQILPMDVLIGLDEGLFSQPGNLAVYGMAKLAICVGFDQECSKRVELLAAEIFQYLKYACGSRFMTYSEESSIWSVAPDDCAMSWIAQRLKVSRRDLYPEIDNRKMEPGYGDGGSGGGSTHNDGSNRNGDSTPRSGQSDSSNSSSSWQTATGYFQNTSGTSFSMNREVIFVLEDFDGTVTSDPSDSSVGDEEDSDNKCGSADIDIHSLPPLLPCDVIASTKSIIEVCINSYVRFYVLREECHAFRRTLRSVLNVLDGFQNEADDQALRLQVAHGGPAFAIPSGTQQPQPPAAPSSPALARSNNYIEAPMRLLKQAAVEGGKVLERCTRMRVLPVLATTGHLLTSLTKAWDDIDDALRMLQVSSVGLQVVVSRDLLLVRQDVEYLRQHMDNEEVHDDNYDASYGWSDVPNLIRDELQSSHGVVAESLVQELVRRGVVRDRYDCEDQLEELRMEMQDVRTAKALYDHQLIEAVKLLSLQQPSPSNGAATSPPSETRRNVYESQLETLLECPISKDVMRDPVLVIESGTTYDRKCLCELLRSYPDLEPATGQRLKGPIRYVANNAVRDVIELVFGASTICRYDDQEFLQEYHEVWDRRLAPTGQNVNRPFPTAPVEPSGGDRRPAAAEHARVDPSRQPPTARTDRSTVGNGYARAATPTRGRPETATATGDTLSILASCALAKNGAASHGLSSGREPTCLSILPTGSGSFLRSCTVWNEGAMASRRATRMEWRVATGSLHGTHTVWDPVRHERAWSYRIVPALSAECCAAVFKNGTRAITAGRDPTSIVVRNLETDQSLYGLNNGPAPAATILCCTVFANDTRVLGGFGDRTVKVWTLVDGELLCTLRGHAGRVLCCAAFQCNKRAMSGGSDGSLIVWDLSRRSLLFQLSGHYRDVLCCAVHSPCDFNKAKSVAVSGDIGGTVIVWDLIERRALHRLRGHTGPVHCCALFADGRRAVTGGADQTLQVWDVTSGRALYRHPLRGHNGIVRCCSVFMNDTRLVSGGDDGTLRVWSLPTNDEGVEDSS